MKGYFLKAGKYGSAAKESVVVSDVDVEEKKIIDIAPQYANYFIEEGVFIAGNFKAAEPPTGPKPIEKMTIAELKALATEKEIDLGDASKKDEILLAFTKAEEPPEGKKD